MATITISLTPERLQQLQAVAERFQVAPEELVHKALDHTLRKNAELYQRLA